MNQAFFSVITRIIEMASTNEQERKQLQINLQALRDDLISINQQEPHSTAFELQVVPSEKEQYIQELQENMTNQGAFHYLQKILPDNLSRSNKLAEVAKALSSMSNVPYSSDQFNTFQGIYSWIDSNWEVLEPFTGDLMIIDCSV